MRTTAQSTRFAPPRLAVPPPASHDAPNLGVTGRMILRRVHRRHAATLGAMATIAVLIALLDRLRTATGPAALPLWPIVAAGLGAVAVGASVRRLEVRERRASGDRAAAGTRPPVHAPGTPGHVAAERAHEPSFAGSWRSALLRVLAALSVVSLMIALVVPDDARVPILGAGLIGMLAVRLLVAPPRGAGWAREAVGPAGAERRAPADERAVDPAPDHAADVVQDALLDSFPASDPPSWGSLCVGPPATPGWPRQRAR